MAGIFDPLDRDSWYFGLISREESQQILKEEREGGIFLVRDSTSCPGDYVLCVKEDNKVSHYIINKIEGEKTVYRIGEQDFPSLADLLTFYKFHYLDSTPLIRPASKKMEQVVTKYEFNGRDPDDLPFHRGEVLTVVRKDEEQWWTAKNAQGQVGSIPVTYVQKFDPKLVAATSPQNGARNPPRPASTETPTKVPTPKDLPAMAKVIKDRLSIYDQSQLQMKVGDVIEVTKINPNGWWEGNLGGKSGSFPATYIEWVEETTAVPAQ